MKQAKQWHTITWPILNCACLLYIQHREYGVTMGTTYSFSVPSLLAWREEPDEKLINSPQIVAFEKYHTWLIFRTVVLVVGVLCSLSLANNSGNEIRMRRDETLLWALIRFWLLCTSRPANNSHALDVCHPPPPAPPAFIHSLMLSHAYLQVSRMLATFSEQFPPAVVYSNRVVIIRVSWIRPDAVANFIYRKVKGQLRQIMLRLILVQILPDHQRNVFGTTGHC